MPFILVLQLEILSYVTDGDPQAQAGFSRVVWPAGGRGRREGASVLERGRKLNER